MKVLEKGHIYSLDNKLTGKHVEELDKDKRGHI